MIMSDIIQNFVYDKTPKKNRLVGLLHGPYKDCFGVNRFHILEPIHSCNRDTFSVTLKNCQLKPVTVAQHKSHPLVVVEVIGSNPVFFLLLVCPVHDINS